MSYVNDIEDSELTDELEIHINNFFEQKNLKDLINNSSESRN